ncbi:MAG TPA: response regulator [Nitrospirota bacterium]|nr:response regulator [Nitrospirota bacterium]
MGISIKMQALKTKHVLVIDDDAATLFAYKMLFKQHASIMIHACETLDHALERIAARFFDLVITDLRLTGEGSEEGMEIMRCIRRLQPSTKVILITGYGSEQVKAKAFDLGASFYFEKPVHPTDMFDALRKLLIIDQT